MKKIVIILLILSLFTGVIFAQFGKNKIREQDFKWNIYSTKNFDIYYYEMPYEIVARISKIAEKTLKEYEKRLNIKVEYKTPLILYLNKKEFSQTNIIDGFIGESIGGFVELRKRRLVIPFDGDFFDFERVLKHELVHVLHYQYMYPSNMPLRELYKSISQPPLWLIEGMAEYFSNDWQPIGELILRENILTSTIPSVALMNDSSFYNYGYYAYKLAQSFVEYLADEYGEDKIVILFKRLSTRISVDYKKEFEKIFGIKLKVADEMWQEHLKKIYWQDALGKENPYKIFKIVDFKKEENVQFIFPKLSPGKEVVALYANYKDEINILLINSKTGELIKNLTKSLKLDAYRGLKINSSSLVWGERGENLFYLANRINKDVIIKQNILTGKINKIEIDKIDTIESITVRDDKIYFIGKEDIYLNIYSVSNYNNKNEKNLEKHTSNIYYKKDLEVEGENIFFIEKNETGDSINKLNIRTGMKQMLYQTDTINSLKYSNGFLYFDRFFSDAAYICALNLDNNKLYQVTESFNSTLYPDVNKDKLVFNVYRSGNYKLAIKDIDTSQFTELIDNTFPEEFEIVSVNENEIEEIKNNSKDYKVKIVPDYIAGSLEYNSGGYFKSYTTVMGMDMLGDYRFMANLDLTAIQDFEDIDFQLSFNYLKKRYTLGGAVYSWTDYFINAVEGFAEYTEKNMGILGSISYPLTYKDRLELSLNYNRKKINYLEWIERNDVDFNEYNLYLSYIRDSSRWWGYYHPLSGYRFRLTYQNSFEMDEDSLKYGMALGDFRYYLKLSSRISVAQRLVYGEYWDRDAQNFKLGGINTVRGYSYQSLLGHKILLYNAELRFPVIDYLALALPKLDFLNIRGLLFYDMAFIGDAGEKISFLKYENDSPILKEEIKASMGYGIRMYLGSFLHLKFDWAWRTNLKTKKGSYFHFGIGSDF